MATINDGNIVYMESDRDKKNWMQCNLRNDKPRIYDSKTKKNKIYILYRIFTFKIGK